MENLAIIHAGPVAPSLKLLTDTLALLGVREKYFMTDLIETLSYEDEFTESLSHLTNELIYGQYFYNHVAKASGEKINNRDTALEFLTLAAKASFHVANYLHTTLKTEGLYNDGKFPYEFQAFDGRIIYLRPHQVD